MENDEVRVVALHDNPDLIEDCIKLLNDEWPRSKTARFELFISFFLTVRTLVFINVLKSYVS
jgi:hypothetical protein